jgi:hypothetical protein
MFSFARRVAMHRRPISRQRSIATCTAAAAIAIALLIAPSPVQACPPHWDLSPGTGTGGGPDAQCNAAITLPNGDVVVGGNFLHVSGINASYIARYRPSTNTWSPYGSGLPNHVSSITADSGGGLIAGGRFLTTSLKNIARWTDSSGTWSSVGGGLGTTPNDYVTALLTLPNGITFAGGSFTTTGTGTPISSVARWMPGQPTWAGWNFTFTGGITAMAVLPNGDVIAGGNALYRWSAVNDLWSPVSAPSGGISQIAVASNGDLLIGIENSGATSGIWRQDTFGVWTSMGSFGAAGPAAFAIAPDGDLYTYGGYLPHTGNSFSFARWDTSLQQWLPIAADLRPAVIPFAPGAITRLSNGDLCVAGSFFAAGTQSVRNVAIWSFRPTCPADFNCSGGLDVQDVVDYINAWFANDPAADFDRAGGPQISDIFSFLSAWFAGC